MNKISGTRVALKRWRRALPLLPILAIVFLVAAVGLGRAFTGNISLAGIVSVLKAPLAVFAERSPGGRGPGGLLSTKPDLGHIRRGLASALERCSRLVSWNPVDTEILCSINGDRENGFLSEVQIADSDDQIASSLSFANVSLGNSLVRGGNRGFPVFSTSSFGKSVASQEIAGAFNDDLPFGSGPIPETQGFDLVPPANLPLSISLEDQPFAPAPLNLPLASSSLVGIPVPEPSSWPMMLAGLLAIGAAVRGRPLMHSGPRCAE